MADEDQPEGIDPASAMPRLFSLPGEGRGWVRLKGAQGWRDNERNLWKKDKKHKDHWDVSDPHGNKIREVDFRGVQIWPEGPKNRNKRPK